MWYCREKSAGHSEHPRPLPIPSHCEGHRGTHRGGGTQGGERTYGGRPGQRDEEQGTWASHTQNHREAGYGRPVDRGAWTAKTVKRPRQQPAHPQYANYWAPLTRKRHTMPHSAQPQHTNYWAPRTRKRHQQEHQPQRPRERSDPTQYAKGRTGDCPGPRKGTTTRRNVTQGGTEPLPSPVSCHPLWALSPSTLPYPKRAHLLSRVVAPSTTKWSCCPRQRHCRRSDIRGQGCTT